jgi:hypothetical protein
MTDGSAASPYERDPTARGALGAWWWQGLRSAFLLRPDWSRLQTTPAVIAWLVIVPELVRVCFERLYIHGPARFYSPALLWGWLVTVVTLWVCWLLVPRPRGDGTREPPSAVALFAMFTAQELTVDVVSGLVLLPMARSAHFSSTATGLWTWWSTWIVVLGWYAAAQLCLVWRSGSPRVATRIGAALLLVGTVALHLWMQPPRLWYPSTPQSTEASASASLTLTQEQLERQPQLLQEKLQAIGAGRPGIVNVFAITFAPYADDVFQRESDLVAAVMQERFGAAGRTIQLVNNRSTIGEWPWATPLNLHRSIQRMSQVMKRDKDILFIHLTSHGARNGELSAEFWPLSIDPVTPQMIRGWLDEAGIRYRVISVSACYSGSWIEPLSDPGTLVMTAADESHTSYGCGRGSTLTYFGRAMFDEQLRHTWSFEKAHAAARAIIEQREREAGKTDGYSNPQIRVGELIRDRLAQLETQRSGH